MRIDERISGNALPAFSFEFFPPKTEDGARNLEEALAALSTMDPTFVSVTYGAGGTPGQKLKTIDIVSRMKADFGLEAMAHFTCVGATVAELRETLDLMRERGVENVLALRGDPPQGQDEWTATEGGLHYSRELIEMIRADYDFAIGAACFPEVHIHATDADSDLRYTKEKVDAGAQFLITGIMPITNAGQIQRMTSMCGSCIPDRLQRELELRADDPRAATDLGVAYATLQCADLLANGAPGIHFYTLNRSPATRAILSALRTLSPWESQPGFSMSSA